MADGLISIAYVSRNAISGGVDEITAGVNKILETSRIRNPQRGVTGALLYSDNCFAQVLEGPCETVAALYQRIEIDPRHSDLIQLHRQDCSQRYFEDWSMAFVPTRAIAEEQFSLDDAITNHSLARDPTYGQDLALKLYKLMQRRALEAGDLSWAELVLG